MHPIEAVRSYVLSLPGLAKSAVVLADLINLPAIVGAFLAGLSVNVAAQVIPRKGN